MGNKDNQSSGGEARKEPRHTREFEHYSFCNRKDPDNCSGCALTTGGEEGPNYAAWPLSYIESHRVIPAKWKKAFANELKSDNKAYVNNLIQQVKDHWVAFSDGEMFTAVKNVG